jgi:hypothetical protein
MVISFFLLTNCESVRINPRPQVIFTIVTWNQSYNKLFEKYNNVEIYFSVENTGILTVDYFEVYFEAICIDGTSFIKYTNGSNLRSGVKYTDKTYIDTAGLKVESVKIVDQYLKRY